MAVARLKRRAEFLRVAAVRRKWAAPGLVLQAAAGGATDGKAGFRVGFTVSRKVGNAVARNRARRRLRAAAELVMPQQAAAGYDYVLIGRQETLTRPFESLLKDLRVALKRVGALREPQGADKASGDRASGNRAGGDKASGNHPCGDKTP